MSELSERVQKHRRHRQQAGYKTVSFMVTPEEYKILLEAQKSHHMLSLREVIMYYVSGQPQRENNWADSPEYSSYPSSTPEERHKGMQNSQFFGDSWYFENRREFVVTALKHKRIYNLPFPYEVIFLKDFDDYHQALAYYKRQLTTKRRIGFYQRYAEAYQVAPEWYQLCSPT